MTMKPLLIAAVAACEASVAGCNSVKPEQAADTIYTAGNIITVIKVVETFKEGKPIYKSQ